MLAKYNLESLNGVNTPWPPGLELPKTWEKPDETITKSYIKKTGSLNYLAVGSRADLTYTVSRLYEANAGPSNAHIRLLQHLFRYITKTLTLCPCYGGKLPMDNLALCAYADAAFADDLLMRYSTGGHVVFLAGGPILWKSKKQGIITLSSTEAEFINQYVGPSPRPEADDVLAHPLLLDTAIKYPTTSLAELVQAYKDWEAQEGAGGLCLLRVGLKGRLTSLSPSSMRDGTSGSRFEPNYRSRHNCRYGV